MKVLILGGYGNLGLLLGEIFAKDEDVKEVALADINVDKSKLVSAELKSSKVVSVKVDVTDHQSLVRLIRKYDIVVNFTAPYNLFGLKVIRASLEAGKNYVDVCNDIDTIRGAFDLHHEAEKAGISICISCGEGPGLSNIFIKYLADKLDEVKDIEIFFALGLGNGASKGTYHSLFKIYMKSNIQYINGEFRSPQDRGVEVFEFSDPIGSQVVYYATFAEIFLLPRSIRNVKNVNIKMCLFPEWFNEWLFRCIDIGLGEEEQIDYNDKKISPKDFMAFFLNESPYLSEEIIKHKESDSVYTVKGTKDGIEKIYTGRIFIPPEEGTVMTAYQVAKMLLEGRVIQKGVLAPEVFIDAEETIKYWRDRGAKLVFE